MKKRVYRISPSLLNSFSKWLNAQEDYELYWGKSDAPLVSPEEYERRCYNELIAYINKEPQQPNEAADRGTCLNEIVDCLIGAMPNPLVWWERREGVYVAKRNEFEFEFDAQLVDDVALAMRNGIPQYHLQRLYRDAEYDVILHGYADYIFPTQIWDLKTTNKYEGEKYRGNWQRLLYPVVAVDDNDLKRCDTFGFLAVECKKLGKEQPTIAGRIWRETYDVNIEEARDIIMEFVTGIVVPQINIWISNGIIDIEKQTLCYYD